MKTLFRILLLPFRLVASFWAWVGLFFFIRQIKPRRRFHQLAAPPAPDYRDPESWAATPERPGKTTLRPEGIEPAPDGEPVADVFFLHPTSFYSPIAWNQPPDHRRSREILDELILPGEATAFNDHCRVFAPRYRQATLYSFLDGGPDGRRALELAYDDVERAFRHYVEHWNQGRPFFLASHSQGTTHAIRLAEQVIDSDEELASRLVAAYLIGYSFPVDKLPGLERLVAAEGPADTGCIVAWDTWLEGHGPNHRLDRSEHWYPDGEGGHWQRRAWKEVLGVNPIRFRRDREKAPKGEHLGGVHVKLNGKIPWGRLGGEAPLGLETQGLSKPLTGEVSARIGRDGYLRISRPRSPVFLLGVMPGGNYHNHDYALFWMDLRQNVERRLSAFLALEAGAAAEG